MSDCPFCALVANDSLASLVTTQEEIVYQDEFVTAFINCDWWKNNHGGVVVVPNEPFDNLYSISDEALARVNIVAKQIAIAMKQAYRCDGISTRQHNEAAGNQTVFHFHLHVFPRYTGDELYLNHDQWFRADIADRLVFAQKLRDNLSSA